jgi:hypothetical protein
MWLWGFGPGPYQNFGAFSPTINHQPSYGLEPLRRQAQNP